MDGEFCHALAWRNCLGHPSNRLDFDTALDLLLVDVVDGLIGDGQSALLSPVKHIGLLHFAGIHEYICDKSSVN